MENASSKIRIIEFNGLPGTGKTTISKILGEKLAKEQHTPVLYSYYRHRYHLYDFSYLFSPGCYKIFHKLYDFSREFKNPSNIDYIINVVCFLRMYRHYLEDNNFGYLIIEQGVIQGLLSIAYNELIPRNISIKAFLNELGIDHYPILFVNCTCKNSTNIERIEKRKSVWSRVQAMETEEKVKTLITQSDNLSLLRSTMLHDFDSFKILDLDTERTSPDTNARYIMDYLGRI